MAKHDVTTDPPDPVASDAAPPKKKLTRAQVLRVAKAAKAAEKGQKKGSTTSTLTANGKPMRATLKDKEGEVARTTEFEDDAVAQARNNGIKVVENNK